MNILVIGHFGGKNFGDEVMLYSLLSRLTQKNDTDVTVITKERETFYFEEQNIAYRSPSFGVVIQELFKSDVLILGGGTHFHDGYNPKRLRMHYFYLTKILFLYCLFSILNKQIYQLGVGYGPFRGKLVRNLASWSIKLATYTFVRDKTSYEHLKDAGVNLDKTDVSFDLAASHPFFQEEVKTKKDCIGISVTSLRYNEYSVGDEFWSEIFFPHLESLYRSKNISVKIFVFRGGKRESDRALSFELFKRLSTSDEGRVQLIEFTEDTQFFLNEINQCSKFFATRYHSALLGFLCDCELFVIPYHNKLLSLAEDIELADCAVFKLSSSVESLDDRMNDFISDSKEKYLASLPPEKAIEDSRKNFSFI